MLALAFTLFGSFVIFSLRGGQREYLHYNNGINENGTIMDETEARISKMLISDGHCKERRNIFFLKIAKSGSTTVQQLLLRFGMVRDLSFALFVDEFTYPSPTFSEFLLPAPNRSTGFDGQYNIICEHTVYNESELKRWMPGDTFYLANIRHPLTHLKSSINHRKLYTRLNISTSANFLAELLSDPKRHDKWNTTRNISARFFGLNRTVGDTATGDALIQHIDRKFGMVLIMERVDESLVLMKRRLCWSTKDILYLPLRVAEYKGKAKETEQDQEELIAKHRKWSNIDYDMYDHFVTRLQVLALGQRAGPPYQPGSILMDAPFPLDELVLRAADRRGWARDTRSLSSLQESP